jgi:hypothetical protein
MRENAQGGLVEGFTERKNQEGNEGLVCRAGLVALRGFPDLQLEARL